MLDVSGYGIMSQLLFCLSRPADGDGVSPGAGWSHGMIDALDSHERGVDSRCDVCYGEARGEIDESASDVVIYGMVR